MGYLTKTWHFVFLIGYLRVVRPGAALEPIAMNNDPRKVWFVLAKLQMGGIERNRLKIMDQCLQWGVGVSLVLVERKGGLLGEVPALASTRCLGEPWKILFPLRLAKLMRKEQPACIISAFDDVNVMVVIASSLGRARVPILLSNHNAFSVAYAESRGLKRARFAVLRWILPWAFGRAKSVVAVSNGVADDLSASFALPREAIEVLYNPVIDSGFDDRASLPATQPVSEQTLLFVGRLVPQKDISNLLAACALLKQRRPLDVLIVGDGPERPLIEAQVWEMGLADVVRLAGTVQNPLPLMAGSGVLVLPSRFEGLPGVLIEAMACGTQVVSTDCPHGPAEILDGGRYGQLVPVGDPAALAAAIERSLNGDFRVEPVVLRARAAEFSVERATRRYLELAGYDVSTLPPAEPAAPRIRPLDG